LRGRIASRKKPGTLLDLKEKRGKEKGRRGLSFMEKEEVKRTTGRTRPEKKPS